MTVSKMDSSSWFLLLISRLHGFRVWLAFKCKNVRFVPYTNCNRATQIRVACSKREDISIRTLTSMIPIAGYKWNICDLSRKNNEDILHGRRELGVGNLAPSTISALPQNFWQLCTCQEVSTQILTRFFKDCGGISTHNLWSKCTLVPELVTLHIIGCLSCWGFWSITTMKWTEKGL